MDSLIVEPGPPLVGVVRAGGAKNSVLKLMAATLLAEGRHRLSNVPRIKDVDIMAEVLEAFGVQVHFDEGGGGAKQAGQLILDVPPAQDLAPVAPYHLVEKMRASIVVLGPLLARCGYARVSMPGGDDFGERPIDFHLGGLGSMGVEWSSAHGYLEGKATSRGDARFSGQSKDGKQWLVGQRVVLEYPSHTATDNFLMAACLAKGTTVIENAAREPEICDLAAYLSKMGASIKGAGTSRIEVEGSHELVPANHSVVSDRVVAATYLAAVGMAKGEITIEDARIDHMDNLVRKLVAMGMKIEQSGDGLCASLDKRLQAVDVSTLPYPGVATDYKPFLVTLLSVAEGVGIVTENLFLGRFRYIDELRRMGADIRTESHHAVVRGVERLSGAQVRAPDLRAGAALVLAGLCADGPTQVSGASHIDRGYEDLAMSLSSLGAKVQRA